MATDFSVEVGADSGGGRGFRVRGPGHGGAAREREYRIDAVSQGAYAALFEELARDYGTRLPRSRVKATFPEADPNCLPLLTVSPSPDILYGYGDPAVTRVGDLYYLLVTSNDAPDAFPILRSADLNAWEHVGFAFPRGSAPAWAAEGARICDFWAPELHQVREHFLLCFAAREKDLSLAIGIARASAPEGPFTAPDVPLLRGGVIDPHIFIDDDGEPLLFWKEDSNEVWPRLLAALLHDRRELIDTLFPAAESARTASLARALWPWAAGLDPMETFFVLQPLIEAVVADFSHVREALAELAEAPLIEAVLQAMRTPVFAQRLSRDGSELVGERRVVLVNDLAWEGHLVEGVWVTRQRGLYYLFYSGNDFSTADYGIGVAVAEHVFGPYRKREEPLLRSTGAWLAPGHPSVAPGPDGEPLLFLHAYAPGRTGYGAFRALLTAGLDIRSNGVELRRPSLPTR